MPASPRADKRNDSREREEAAPGRSEIAGRVVLPATRESVGKTVARRRRNNECPNGDECDNYHRG
jgi:hypothetical protein